MATAYAHAGWEDVVRVAAQHFGIETFRPGQRELVEAVLAGRDAVGILPTGGGKSLTYQLSSLFLDQLVVVVSPLLALMSDQSRKLVQFAVPARGLESTLSAAARREAMHAAAAGQLDIVVVTPESLLRADVLQALGARGVSLLVVDEAHCISAWGHDFRPAYLGLGHAARRLGEMTARRRPPILALTATATEAVLGDIVSELGLEAPAVIRTSPERHNLRLEVADTPTDTDKLRALQRVLDQTPGQCIIYAATIKAAQAVAHALGPDAGLYHGDLRTAARAAAFDAFMCGRTRVLVATRAFGMGVDKPDVRAVVHYQMPDSLEAYSQEVGRAGRDGQPARALLLYRRADRRVWDLLHRKGYPPEDTARGVLASTVGRDPGSPIDGDGLAERFALAERKVEMLLWELAREGVVTRAPEGFVRSTTLANAPDGVITRVLARLSARRARQRDGLETMLGFAESLGCRTASVVAHFGQTPAKPRCGRCDACDRVHRRRA